jgi:hypothetical protein
VAAIEEAIIAARRRFPHLGPRKLLWMLERRDRETNWPAASTIGDILKRAGLVEKARCRRPALDPPRVVVAARAANEEWAADFKGWFRTRDQWRIDPLTITDSHTRFLFDTRITPQTVEGRRPFFERAFKTYGLPWAIRCDNGAPLGSPGPGGPDAAFGIVAQARDRTAFRPPGLAPGERTPRAHASHAEETDDVAAGRGRRGAAGAF